MDELKEINHQRAYKIEVRYCKGGEWGNFFTQEEFINGLSAEEAKEAMNPDYIEDISTYVDEDGEPARYDAASIRISPRGEILADDDECLFFVY